MHDSILSSIQGSLQIAHEGRIPPQFIQELPIVLNGLLKRLQLVHVGKTLPLLQCVVLIYQRLDHFHTVSDQGGCRLSSGQMHLGQVFLQAEYLRPILFQSPL